MDQALLSILQAADHPQGCEAPPGFDYRSGLNRIRLLQPKIEGVTGREFEIDENVQDASFFTDLATYYDVRRSEGGTLRHTILAIRFSSFGNLFTTWSVCPDDLLLEPEVIKQSVSITEAAGFIYVDADSLQSSYTGCNPHLAGTSWWIRFFDYL